MAPMERLAEIPRWERVKSMMRRKEQKGSSVAMAERSGSLTQGTAVFILARQQTEATSISEPM